MVLIVLERAALQILRSHACLVYTGFDASLGFTAVTRHQTIRQWHREKYNLGFGVAFVLKRCIRSGCYTGQAQSSAHATMTHLAVIPYTSDPASTCETLLCSSASEQAYKVDTSGVCITRVKIMTTCYRHELLLPGMQQCN